MSDAAPRAPSRAPRSHRPLPPHTDRSLRSPMGSPHALPRLPLHASRPSASGSRWQSQLLVQLLPRTEWVAGCAVPPPQQGSGLWCGLRCAAAAASASALETRQAAAAAASTIASETTWSSAHAASALLPIPVIRSQFDVVNDERTIRRLWRRGLCFGAGQPTPTRGSSGTRFWHRGWWNIQKAPNKKRGEPLAPRNCGEAAEVGPVCSSP